MAHSTKLHFVCSAANVFARVGGVVPAQVCLSICETICLCVNDSLHERKLPKAEDAKQLPLTSHTCCGGRTHRPEPAGRGTSEKCLRTTEAPHTHILYNDY